VQAEFLVTILDFAASGLSVDDYTVHILVTSEI
jgi:hypothetical protein